MRNSLFLIAILLSFSLFGNLFSDISVVINYPQNQSYNQTAWQNKLQYTVSGISDNDLVANGGHIYCNISKNSQPEILMNNCGNITNLNLNEGTNSIIVKVYDNSTSPPEQKANAEVIFTLDFTPPVVTITSPANNSFRNSNQLNVQFTVSDPLSGIKECKYKLDSGSNQSVNCAGGSGTISLTGLSEGPHTLVVYAEDNAENVGYAVLAFTVDTTAPTVTITSPTNNQYFNVSTIPVVFTLSDANPGSGLSGTCKWGHNSTAFTCNVTGTNTVYYQVEGNDGQKTITIKAYDSAGNEGQASVNVNVDRQIPTVTITGPNQNGSWFNDLNLVINFTVNDASPVTCSWSTVQGSPGSGQVQNCNNNGQLNQITGITWQQGNNQITLTVTDAAGNSNSVTRSFSIDVIPPTVNITSPTNNQYFNVSTIPVVFTLNDTGGSNLINQCKWGHNSTTFTCNVTGTNTVYYQVDANDGQKTITIKAYDSAGNEGQASVNVNVDRQIPTVTITGPNQNGLWFNNPNLVINFTVNDASPVNCSFVRNDTGVETPVTCNKGSNSITGQTWADGQYQVTIIVDDAAGNRKVETRTFGIDTVVPNVSISSPSNGTLHNNSNVAVQFSVRDDLAGVKECWWTNNSGATNTTISCTSGSGSITGVNWPDGVNNIIVYVRDNAGNVNFATVQFTVDTKAPAVTVTSPANNSYVNKSSVNITFVANDATTNLVQCKYSINSGSSTNIDCSTGLIQLTGLADGVYVVNVSAEDELGNIGWTILVMTIDTVKPTVQITSPSLDNIYFNNANLVILFSVSDTNLDKCWYVDNNGLPQLVNCASGQISGVTWANGWHTLVLYTNDSAGNVNSATRTFYINGSAFSQTLNLVEGWNLISFNITHLNASPKSVFAPIIDKVRTVRFYYNGTWYDWTPNVGGTITELKPGYAYFVNVSQATSLTAIGYQETVTSNGGAGTPIYPFQINVYSGWNLLGVYVNSTISGFPNSMTIGQIVYPFQNGVPVKVKQGTGLPISTPNGYDTQIAVGEGFWFYSSTSGAYWPKV